VPLRTTCHANLQSHRYGIVTVSTLSQLVSSPNGAYAYVTTETGIYAIAAVSAETF
jgi:hypothetical protein